MRAQLGKKKKKTIPESNEHKEQKKKNVKKVPFSLFLPFLAQEQLERSKKNVGIYVLVSRYSHLEALNPPKATCTNPAYLLLSATAKGGKKKNS